MGVTRFLFFFFFFFFWKQKPSSDQSGCAICDKYDLKVVVEVEQGFLWTYKILYGE